MTTETTDHNAEQKEFLIGDDGFQCLTEVAVYKLKSKRNEFVQMEHSDISNVIKTRNFYPMVSNDCYLLADVRTGTLYDAMNGVCLSSSQNRLIVASQGESR